jgi:alpha-L-fucosidase
MKRLSRGHAALAAFVALCTASFAAAAGETPAQRDARMAWWRDAKFGMFIHWGPCTVGDREIGWGRKANRPWDISGVQTPRTTDPDYDAYYKRFNPVRYDADAWVRLAQQAGMKYMVLIAKHHDGFSQFDSKLTDHDIMATPYGRDIVGQFVDACHKHDMKAGLYYSTRDWHHPDYLVGDNAKYDAWYRGQVEELLSNYGKIDVMWFDHVGGRDWGKWKFDELFAMLHRRQPGLIVNNRAAAFCGPATPGDRGPASPELARLVRGDFDTPEQQIGAMNLARDWESCMILSPTPEHDGWSYRSTGKTRPLDECIRMLASAASGGGNLLLNFGPDQFGEFRPEEVAIARGMGAWLRRYGPAIYGTRGGPFTNGAWGGSTHRGSTVYLHMFDGPADVLRLASLAQTITAARVFPSGEAVEFTQGPRGVDVTVPERLRAKPVTVVELSLDRPVTREQQVGGLRSQEKP